MLDIAIMDVQKYAIKLCQVMKSAFIKGYDAGVHSSIITICEECESMKERQILL
jgi:hypothetical protein